MPELLDAMHLLNISAALLKNCENSPVGYVAIGSLAEKFSGVFLLKSLESEIRAAASAQVAALEREFETFTKAKHVTLKELELIS